MEVIIMPNREAATTLTARLIADRVKTKPASVLGLATGSTMEEVYGKLASMDLDFSYCTTFHLDEYIGLEPTDKNSHRHYMNEHFFKKINIQLNNTYFPNGMAKNMKEECDKYERLMIDCGGLDMQILGLGKTGHIGFNEPLSSLFSRTREKTLTQTTIAQVSPFFDKLQNMPKRVLTMGVGTILEARKVIMLATGRNKSEILAKAVEGPITSMISATALQLHPSCTVIVDEDAASLLTEKEYYRWIFQNEPQWEPYRESI